MNMGNLKNRLISNVVDVLLLPAQRSSYSALHSSKFTVSASSYHGDGSVFAKVQRIMALFKLCSSLRDLEQIHARIIRIGFDQNLFVIGKIIQFCAVSEQGDMDYAASVFPTIENPDGFIWNTMIRGFGNTNRPIKAFEFYRRMLARGEVADNFTFSFMLKVSWQLGSLKLGRQLQCNVLKLGLESHVFVKNTLLHMYGMHNDIKTARLLFDEMSSPGLVAWNTIIDCHVYCGRCKEALDLFLRMLQSGIQPDEATLVVTLSACSKLSALDFGRLVHSYVENTSLLNIVSVSNALIDMYAKCGAIEEAYVTFKNMKEKNIVCWNTMIIGFATHGHSNEALALFSNVLKDRREKPDSVTFLGVLCACNHGGMVEEGRRYFSIMIKIYNIQPGIKHYGCMVDILGRAGFLEEAYCLIRSMPIDRNAVVWRMLLAACRVHGNIELGEKVRKHLLQLEPDHCSDYILLANIYADMGRWNEVIRVRKSMRDRKIQKLEPGNSSI